MTPLASSINEAPNLLLTTLVIIYDSNMLKIRALVCDFLFLYWALLRHLKVTKYLKFGWDVLSLKKLEVSRVKLYFLQFYLNWKFGIFLADDYFTK